MALTKVPYSMQKGDITVDTEIQFTDFTSVASLIKYLSRIRVIDSTLTVRFPTGETVIDNEQFELYHPDGKNIHFVGMGSALTTLKFTNMVPASGFGAFKVEGNYQIGLINAMTIDGDNHAGHANGGPTLGSGDPNDPIAVRAREGAVIVLGSDVIINNFARNGVFAYNNSSILADFVKCYGCGSDSFVASNNSSVRCILSLSENCWGAGYFADASGVIWADGSTASNTKKKGGVSAGQGFSATNHGRIFARAITIGGVTTLSKSFSNASHGFLAQNAGEIWAERCESYLNAGDGINANIAGMAYCSSANIHDNALNGVSADRFANIDCSGSTIDFNGNAGIIALAGSTVVARGLVSVSTNGTYGFFTRSRGTIDAQGVSVLAVVTGNGTDVASPPIDTSTGISDSRIYAQN